MNAKYLLRGLLAALLLSTAPLAASAQTPSDGGPVPQDQAAPTDPTAVPLDGGASLLLASGVAYGLCRLHKRRQR